ncbi:hypothetical protein AAHE18_07G144900 [Arachis hypogaea]
MNTRKSSRLLLRLFSFNRVVSAAAGTGADNWHRHGGTVLSPSTGLTSVSVFLFFCLWSFPSRSPSSSFDFTVWASGSFAFHSPLLVLLACGPQDFVFPPRSTTKFVKLEVTMNFH